MLSNQTKLDYAFKLLAGRSKTDIKKEWFEEKLGYSFKLHLNELWSDEIPSDPTGVEYIEHLDKYELTEDLTSSDHQVWFIIKDNKRVTDIISPIYGSIYNVRIFDYNDTEIPTGFSVSWYFDYNNGILFFEDNPTRYGLSLPLKISCYIYKGNKGYIPDNRIEIDGGSAEEVYLLSSQVIDGGNANGQ